MIQGKVESVIEVIRDITEHRKLEAQFIQAQKMESVGRLAGGVAHDYNNMLSVILGYSELALEKLDPADPLYEDLREIHKAAVRSTDITRQLLAFARKQTIAPVALDLNEAVEGMLKMLRRLIGEDIDLAWLPETGLWPVKMDPSQVDQLLANLCVNARDAIDGVGQITIETDTATFDDSLLRRSSRISFPVNMCSWPSVTMVAAWTAILSTRSSNPSSQPRRLVRARALDWPRSTASSNRITASSTSTANRAKGPPSKST